MMTGRFSLCGSIYLFCGIDFAAENWLTKASIVEMKFLDWYVKISAGGALIGASMELFMIKTGFYDKVTVLESEKRAWESSPEAQAIREALNPWRNQDTEQRKNA
ncbi:DNA mismatch repair protein [Salix suchowensis]|nr:DNA mismatch repair protein [Salix suchowensis]